MTSIFNTDLIVLGTAISATGILGFVVLFQNPKSITSVSYFLFSLVSIAWGILNYASYQVTDVATSLWLWRLVIFTAVWFCFGIYNLAYVFPNENISLSKTYKYALVPFVVLSSILTLTPLVFSRLSSIPIRGTVPVIVPGILIPVFGLTVVGLVCGAVYEFLKKLRSGTIERNHQTTLIMVGTAITFFLLILCNFILPIGFKIYVFIPFGAIFIFPFIACTAYAIIHYHLFNVRVIATEIFAFVLTIVTLVQIVFSTSTPELIFRIGSFLVVLAFVILLIRSVLNEVRQRERIEKLAEELSETNERQEGLIHFISHEVKGFLARYMGAFAGLTDGDYGALPDPAKELVSQLLPQSRKDSKMVMDLLQASNLKKGMVTFQMQPFNAKDAITAIVEKLKPSAEAKKLTLSFVADGDASQYVLVGDSEKLADHVFQNLIENSINYTPTGTVTVSLEKHDEKITFKVQDTGIGLSDEDKGRLFTEGGHGKESIKINVHSTGYGLFIAKSVVDAHHGKIWAESDGPGKGSRFIAELPLTQPVQASTELPAKPLEAVKPTA